MSCSVACRAVLRLSNRAVLSTKKLSASPKSCIKVTFTQVAVLRGVLTSLYVISTVRCGGPGREIKA